MKLNKGSILKASVEYVRELKKDKEKLVLFESKQKTMEAKYQKMLIRIFVRISCKQNKMLSVSKYLFVCIIHLMFLKFYLFSN